MNVDSEWTFPGIALVVVIDWRSGNVEIDWFVSVGMGSNVPLMSCDLVLIGEISTWLVSSLVEIGSLIASSFLGCWLLGCWTTWLEEGRRCLLGERQNRN